MGRWRMPTQAVEEYLESIYKMEKRGLPVIGARLAEELGVSPPTVTEMLTRLCSKGYVDKDPGSGTVLTERGKAAAEVLIRRHLSLIHISEPTRLRRISYAV